MSPSPFEVSNLDPFRALLDSGAISALEYQALLQIEQKEMLQDDHRATTRSLHQQEPAPMNLKNALQTIKNEEAVLAGKLAALSRFKPQPPTAPVLGHDHAQNARSALATVAGNTIQNALDAIALSARGVEVSATDPYRVIDSTCEVVDSPQAGSKLL